MLITFANSLDQDQDRQNVSPVLDPLIVFMKESFEKVNFEKKPEDENKSMKNYQACFEKIMPQLQYVYRDTVNDLKFQTLFFFCLRKKMLVIRAGSHKMLV